MKTSKISLYDFKFEPAGYGHCKVTYTSPKTGQSWSRTTDKTWMTDQYRGDEDVTIKALEALKGFCKQRDLY